MQLVRVRLTGDSEPPPLFTEVEITWPTSIRAILADIASFVVSG